MDLSGIYSLLSRQWGINPLRLDLVACGVGGLTLRATAKEDTYFVKLLRQEAGLARWRAETWSLLSCVGENLVVPALRPLANGAWCWRVGGFTIVVMETVADLREFHEAEQLGEAIYLVEKAFASMSRQSDVRHAIRCFPGDAWYDTGSNGLDEQGGRMEEGVRTRQRHHVQCGSSVIMHGDLGPSNMGLVGDSVTVLDPECICIGQRGEDALYAFSLIAAKDSAVDLRDAYRSYVIRGGDIAAADRDELLCMAQRLLNRERWLRETHQLDLETFDRFGRAVSETLDCIELVRGVGS